jgi:hypothetical protein
LDGRVVVKVRVIKRGVRSKIPEYVLAAFDCGNHMEGGVVTVLVVWQSLNRAWAEITLDDDGGIHGVGPF